jgi:hypothetical protein
LHLHHRLVKHHFVPTSKSLWLVCVIWFNLYCTQGVRGKTIVKDESQEFERKLVWIVEGIWKMMMCGRYMVSLYGCDQSNGN